MKKNLLIAMACICIAGMAVAGNPAKNIKVVEDEITLPALLPVSGINPVADESKRTFHVIPVSGEKNKFLVTVGKKTNTKVSIRVYDRNGNLLYTERQKTDKDFAKVLNLQALDGAIISISDSNGLEKSYSF